MRDYQLNRLAAGGAIDREKPLHFTFNGRAYTGYQGDTLASALLANGVHLVARSFKYHRPRGIHGSGSEEPNALLRVGRDPAASPNLKATQVELHEGLEAASQNCWPNVEFDLGSIIGRLSPLLPAGFYYKTFKWPRRWWRLYEHYIRRTAGMGRAPEGSDPDNYAHHYTHCDVLVVGGGAAGLAAAQAASRTGARTILLDERSTFGGTLLGRSGRIDGMPSVQWVHNTVKALRDTPDIQLLPRTMAFGYYDDNLICAVEQFTFTDAIAPNRPRQRLWWIRARQVVLATGALERGLVFGQNDVPGVMLASAIRDHIHRSAVRPGRKAVVFTNNDSGYWAACDMVKAGIAVQALVDVRLAAGARAEAEVRGAGIPILSQHVVVACRGRKHVRDVEIVALNPSTKTLHGRSTFVPCDLVGVSGGWNPTVNLFSQAGGKLFYDETQAMFRPRQASQAVRCAGACDGTFDLAECLRNGDEAGRAAAEEAGFGSGSAASNLPCEDDVCEQPLQPLWVVPARRRQKQFVDLQNDITAADVALAAREGYRSVEHLKRYTTLGMGTDQGRTSNVNGLAILAGLMGVEVGKVGTTSFRPPYSPVTFGAIAGDRRGEHYAPVRRTPMHDWHEREGASFVPTGLWLRPQVYRRNDEDLMSAINREIVNVRSQVGVVDVSTLGKIDVQGPDAAAFLDRIYVNEMSRLAVGAVRYGVMLREDGIVFDDGTAARIGGRHFILTTTTANAQSVLAHLEYCHQVLWPALDVHITSVTEDWAAMALAGPRSRKVLKAVTGGADVSNAGLPFMGFCNVRVAGVEARIFRISFSGEMAYEINVPADYGRHVWEAIIEAGRQHGIAPYGTEAMAVLRIEKGHAAGSELNGRTTADDLGLGRLLSTKKDFIGRRSISRPGMIDPRRRQLVGLLPVDKSTPLPRGAQLVTHAAGEAPIPMIGEVTSACYSPNLEMPIALGLVSSGRARLGETITAISPLAGISVPVTIVSPHFIDPKGERLRA